MTRKNKHRVDEVLRALSMKNDCRIEGNEILVLNGKGRKQQAKHDIGNGSWGKIDFLVNYHGYGLYMVSQF